MFFWRMIGRALRRQVSKRLMIAVTILLGSSLATSMFAVMLDVSDKVQAELGSFGANIQVLPQGASIVSDMYEVDSGASAGSIREDELPNLKTIFWAYNIEDFAPFLDTTAAVDGVDVPVVGTWFDQELTTATGETLSTGITNLRSWWAITGSWAQAPDEVMAGSRLASQLGWEPGDRVTLGTGNAQVEVTVTGVFQSGSDEDNQLFVPLAVAQQLADRPGEVGSIEVRAITTPDNDLAERAARDPSTLSADEWETWYCTAYVSSIAYQIEEAMTNVAAKPVRQVADTEGVILNKTQLIMSVVAIFAMVAASLGIANLVTASVMERSKEVGLMKALGARNKSIVGLILTETLVVALIGGVAGFGVGIGLAQLVGRLVFGSGITIRPIVPPLMALVILLTVVIGCLPAMRYLLRLRPAQVLHGR
ncbi:ABC transporter permease [Brooklawnia cerclae]|uniref:ABC transport system permease protein n=1 Tax=Brooklawnia cerclae TaxID=349934 RepID=A0ABX0SHJ6_9ACTN|nr:ABC transporter permease [Brooklawnia cerclae]NIH57867.1 putative ABC transport system permease protein [Brooklawnia cerclae]